MSKIGWFGVVSVTQGHLEIAPIDRASTSSYVLLFGGGGSVWAIISVSTKLNTFCYVTLQTAPCYVQSF